MHRYLLIVASALLAGTLAGCGDSGRDDNPLPPSMTNPTTPVTAPVGNISVPAPSPSASASASPSGTPTPTP